MLAACTVVLLAGRIVVGTSASRSGRNSGRPDPVSPTKWPDSPRISG